MTTDVGFNPLDPGFPANPYPHYAALRSTAPVFSTGMGPWLLTRYADVVRVLRDPTMSVEARDTTAFPLPPEMLERAGDRSRGSRSMLTLDPPDHDRLRRLVAKTFPENRRTARTALRSIGGRRARRCRGAR